MNGMNGIKNKWVLSDFVRYEDPGKQKGQAAKGLSLVRL
jgi:hypothetical protein